MKFGYKVSYAFAGIYMVLTVLNLFLTHWNIALVDALAAVLFLRVGNYEEAIDKGRLVYKADTFDYSK